ncbi:MAG: hypothetical protein JST87_12810 [Bacteroidetes bacterium]|nr:hypothetical protein [Bacteroidota bacterium]
MTKAQLYILFLISPVVLFLFEGHVYAQVKPDSTILDVNKVEFVQALYPYSFIEVRKNDVPDDSIPLLRFGKSLPEKYSVNIPNSLVNKSVYLKFVLQNTADTALSVYFFGGTYVKDIAIFKADVNNIRHTFEQVKTAHISSLSNLPLIMLGPKSASVIFVRLIFVKTQVNSLAPRIINKNFTNYFKTELLSRRASIGLITYIVSGILLMMIFYSLAVYLQSFKIEFLFYTGYTLFMGLLLFLKSFLFGATSSFNYIFEGYLDFIMQGAGYIFYMMFIRKFLDTKTKYPFLEKFLTASQWLVGALLVVFSFFYFFVNDFSFINIIQNTTKQILLIIGIVFVVFGFGKTDRLMKYLVWGQLILIFFSIISFLLILKPTLFVKPPPHTSSVLINDSLLYYEIGLILELIFFLMGLAYKNRMEIIERVKDAERLKLENERKEFEKQVAIIEAKQEERNRISADMHDELGSGVTAIRLMSEIVKAKMKDQTLPEIEKISYSANELLNKMNTIIWTMISSNDSVESLVAYIRAYAVEFFENTPVECSLHIAPSISSKELSGEKRRSIFLAVKEALNNVLKHSQAKLVMINIDTNNGLLTIQIVDDGVGIDLDNLRKFGNGMNNMKKRIESIDGEFNIENKNGTTLTFRLQL